MTADPGREGHPESAAGASISNAGASAPGAGAPASAFAADALAAGGRQTTPGGKPGTRFGRLAWWLPLALVYLYAFPYFAKVKNNDELARVLLTRDIVDYGTFHLEDYVPELGHSLDLARGRRGHYYLAKAPAPSFLAIPAYLACKALGIDSLRAHTWAFRVTVVVIPTLLFFLLFWRTLGRFAGSDPPRRAALAAYALGSAAFGYGVLFVSEQTAAAMVGSAFVLAVGVARREARHPALASLSVGFLAALAFATEYPAAVGAAAVAVYLAVRAPARLRTFALMVAGAVPPLVALGAYHAACFGSPFRIGQPSAVDAPVRYAALGLGGPSLESLAAVLAHPASGLCLYAPWVIFAVVGAVAIARDRDARARVGPEALACAAIAAGYLVFLTLLPLPVLRWGWTPGVRYLPVMLPFLGWLAAAGFEATEARSLTRVLAMASVVVASVVHVATATTYPIWPPEIRNPLHELVWHVMREGRSVHSLGTLIGLGGTAAIVPLYMVAAALLFWLLGRGRKQAVRDLAIACALAAVVLAAYRRFPGSDYYTGRMRSFIAATWEPPR